VIYNGIEDVFIEDEFQGRNQEGDKFVKVKFSSVRGASVADKFCLRPTAQVLTDRGWIEIQDVKPSDKIATLIDGKYLEYQPYLEKMEFDCDEELYTVTTRDCHIVCTLNHKLYVQPDKSIKWKLMKAIDVMTKKVYMKKSAIYKMPEIEYYEWQTPSEELNPRYLMNDMLDFIGIVISDGYIKDQYTIQISAQKKRKIAHIMQVCERLNLLPKKYGVEELIIYNPRLVSELIYILVDKHLPNFIWKLGYQQARILFDSLMSCDDMTYYTSSRVLADQMTRLALHCGYSGLIKMHKDHFMISEYEKEVSGTRNVDNLYVNINKYNNVFPINTKDAQFNEKLLPYKGKVICVTVQSHIFYYRESTEMPPIWIGNSSRHGQKCMISHKYNQIDMMFSENGLIPDKIMSPFAVPSRMSIGQIIEGLAAKVAAIEGFTSDATIFRKFDINAISDELEKHGYDRYGTERMYNGMTGEWIDIKVYLVPTYYQRLQKFVVDEVYSISTGPKCIVTRQPLEGKTNNGGLRVGEMEKDCLIAHGTGHFLMEKFRNDSDNFDVYVCRTCGKTPVVNEEKRILICKTCEAAGLDPDVVKVRSTWCSKLFIQEMESCNIGVLQTIEPYEHEVFE
jgi:hypothetical protein